ncbi:hypothetical protein M6B38_345675 [Iris pallida]|uniref:Uncharacterized protein n=1 Tax=Iris pallida TaxID=29817 RepID=A0AAX6GUB4_IRIPA|nr:hypothetical protein M6B38_345675 [Iris pallida]
MTRTNREMVQIFFCFFSFRKFFDRLHSKLGQFHLSFWTHFVRSFVQVRPSTLILSFSFLLLLLFINL